MATGYGYFGPAVSRCGKLLERTNGKQVLVSEATKNLLEGEELGELELHESNHFFSLEPGRIPRPIYELIGPGFLPLPSYKAWKEARRRQGPPP